MRMNPLTDGVANGQIISLQPVTATLDSVPDDMLNFSWRIDKDTNDIVFRRMMDALRVLCEEGDKATALFPIIMGLHNERDVTPLANEKVTNRNVEYRNESLNASQCKAIESALENRLTLIQGPPGTGILRTKLYISSGKTHTLAEMVTQWVLDQKESNSNEKILICAETNIAVDSIIVVPFSYHSYIMLKLRHKNLIMLRIGIQGKIRQDLWQFTLEYHLNEARKSSKREKINERKVVQEFLSKVDVILTTCAKAADRWIKEIQFTRVVLDEVSQSIGIVK